MKSIDMLMENAKKGLIDFVNTKVEEDKIPIYLLRYIFKEVYEEINIKTEMVLKNNQEEWKKNNPLKIDDIEIVESEEK